LLLTHAQVTGLCDKLQKQEADLLPYARQIATGRVPEAGGVVDNAG
jgi:hypothetical protein